MRTTRTLTLAASALLLGTVLAEAKLDPEDRCRSVKLGAIAAHTAATLKCEKRALKDGGASRAACVRAADVRMDRAFVKAEGIASCPPPFEDAIAASRSYVDAQVMQVLATPTPVPTPSPTPGCGNGLVDPGESCDGGVYCDDDCTFRLPDFCCGIAGFACMDVDLVGADQCFGDFQTAVGGARCASTAPGCDPATEICDGSCTPDEFPTTTFCCDVTSGCFERTISDTNALWDFRVSSCGLGPIAVGSCIDDACVAGTPAP